MLEIENLKNDTATYQKALSILLMVTAALERCESRGTHMRIDFPGTQAKFQREIVDSINQLLSGTITQMNQQSQGSTGTVSTNTSSTQSGGFMSDADLCKDMLMTGKYVSGA